MEMEWKQSVHIYICIYMYIQTFSVDPKKVMSGPTSGKTILGLYDTEIWQL